MTDPDLYSRLKECKQHKDWWSAREEIERLIANPPDGVDTGYLNQQVALCTYKDPELRRSSALDHALERLLGRGDVTLENITDAETAGLVGAVHKRRWDLNGRELHLRDALRWYERGAVLANEVSPAKWDGYQAINAAYVADLLADTRNDSSSDSLREHARTLREGVIERLDPTASRWWVTATLLEAQLGLGNRDAYLGCSTESAAFRAPILPRPPPMPCRRLTAGSANPPPSSSRACPPCSHRRSTRSTSPT